jgi:hypothetical protein
MIDKDRPYNKVSPSAFKSIVETIGEVRFLITPDNKFHVGNAHYFTHGSLGNRSGYQTHLGPGTTICGYAQCKDNSFEYYVAYTCGDDNIHGDEVETEETVFLQRLESRGFKRVYKPFGFVW